MTQALITFLSPLLNDTFLFLILDEDITFIHKKTVQKSERFQLKHLNSYFTKSTSTRLFLALSSLVTPFAFEAPSSTDLIVILLSSIPFPTK